MSGYSGYVTSLFSGTSSNQQQQRPPPPAIQNQNQYGQPPYLSYKQPRNQYNSHDQAQPVYDSPSPPVQNYPTSAQPTNTATSTSSWTSSLSTRLANLRKGLTAFSSADEKDDPDSEDSSHVSTVLRAYYIEKGRPFPPWLPPDPKHPSPQPVVQQPQNNFGGYAGYGASQNVYGQPMQGGSGGASGGASGGGLTDLFGHANTIYKPVFAKQARSKTRAAESKLSQ
jgi:Sec1-binding region of Mso1